MAPSRTHRLSFVDALRGAAVLAMMIWHTADSWLEPSWRDRWVWKGFLFFGGIAAPLFLSLAGVGVALAFEGQGKDRLATRDSVIRRGFSIVLLGYLLRFQFWLIDDGGIVSSGGWRIAIPLSAAFGLSFVALRSNRRGKSQKPGHGFASVLSLRHRAFRGRWPCFLLAGGLFAIGYSELARLHVGQINRLLRVDVLQCIGVSVVITAWLRSVCRRNGYIVIGTLLAVGVMTLTPWMKSAVPGPLPDPIAGYLAEWTSRGAPRATLFPLFPWLSYALLGAVAASLWPLERSRSAIKLRVITLGIAAFLGAIAVSEWWPHIHHLMNTYPWSATWFRVAHRFGLVLVLMAALIIVRIPALEVFGRASLVVYWVHLEFAFGLIAIPLKRKLGFAEWCLAFFVLTLLMYHLARGWRNRSQLLLTA